MLTRMHRIRPLLGRFLRFSHSKQEESLQWKQIDETQSKIFKFRRWPHADSSFLKKRFKKKLKDCLEVVQHEELKIPIRHDPALSVEPKHDLTKLLLQGSEELENNDLDPKSQEIPMDKDHLVHFVKETAQYFEFPGRFELPECGFESYSCEELTTFLNDLQELLFVMNKHALKVQRKRKKKDKVVVGPDGPRGDIIPFYNLKVDHRKMLFWRLEMAPQVDRPLIIDMNFDDLMTNKCFNDLKRQVELMMKYNMVQRDPMHFLFANMKEDSFVYRSLKERNVHNFPENYYTVTEKNVLELDGIEKEDLVYLTPDASQTLDKYDESKVYIVGGLVDVRYHSEARKVTYNLAKRIGIDGVRFPLSEYLVWGNISGRNELSLDIVYKLLHTFRATGSWVKALQHIPKRFHRGLTERGRMEANDNAEILEWYDDIRPSIPVKEGTAKRFNSAEFLDWS